jgi:hypothetical protein
MTTTPSENIPAIWDDARDIPFFRITARLFTPEFRLGANLLLACNDKDTAATAHSMSTPHGSSTTAPAGVDNHTQPERDLIPVRVRRTR